MILRSNDLAHVEQFLTSHLELLLLPNFLWYEAVPPNPRFNHHNAIDFRHDPYIMLSPPFQLQSIWGRYRVCVHVRGAGRAMRRAL